MISLNDEQRDAATQAGNVIVTACPGSGKTRVLTARVMRGLTELRSSRERVAALTFTNRAADEIHARLDEENIPDEQLWAGTIHAFALDWILRPYAPYHDAIRFGFSVADEFLSRRLLDTAKEQQGLVWRDIVTARYSRTGENPNSYTRQRAAFDEYKRMLREARLLDYDDVLYLAYSVLGDNPEAAATIASIFRLICIDEAQDLQDLQYGILARIVRAGQPQPNIFLVGDTNQSIYESLGAVPKTVREVADEFGLAAVMEKRLSGNYRSTQRIIDFYRRFRPAVPAIESRTEYAGSRGTITFANRSIQRDALPERIADIIDSSLQRGVKAHDICVIAPQWNHVRSLSRSLVSLLPDVQFDAPGLSPFHSTHENVWFKLSRLLLTRGGRMSVRTRFRWARELRNDLSTLADGPLDHDHAAPRSLLRMINGIESIETEGLPFLRAAISRFCECIGLNLSVNRRLEEAHTSFFQKAQQTMASAEYDSPSDLSDFQNLFSHRLGVVVNTCHGVKGEEFDTVIAFGLLRGYVPNWDEIIGMPPALSAERESKLLYVICSRAKQHLHLISEAGRFTQNRNPYEPSTLLRSVRFDYDAFE